MINFDVSNTPETYTYRTGRTDREKRECLACAFVAGSDHGWLRATEQMISSTIPRRKIEGFEPEADLKPAHTTDTSFPSDLPVPLHSSLDVLGAGPCRPHRPDALPRGTC